ncbi:MAG: aldehyde dehydrogenase family protein, partial [Chloroflexi bacterium]|nr:aldehyde dehydrogenase family protein [Chloroflexota bacterium]
MGRAMAQRYPEAAAVYAEASEALGYDLARVCWEGPEEELRRTAVTQPALVATCLACLAPLAARGAQPDLLAGHSVGEYAALIAAGALSLVEGVRLVARRGELMEAAARRTPGGMAALLGLPIEVVEEVCARTGATLANRNAPGQVILSVPTAALEQAMALAKERGARRVVPLNVSGAFHSPWMATAAARIMNGKTLNAGQICLAPDYVFAPADQLDSFVAEAKASVGRYFPTLKDNPDYTAVVAQRHFDRITGYVEDARAKGATIVEINPAGEDLSQQPHRKIAPTLILNPTDDMAVMQEEIFGPLLPVKTYQKVEEAVDYINAHDRPLALYWFGTD